MIQWRQRRTDTIAKILILTFNDDEEKAIERVLSVLSDEIGLKPVQAVTSPVLSFPGLEIKLYQRRVLRDGEDVPLTRLEYGTLGFCSKVILVNNMNRMTMYMIKVK